MLRLTLKAAFSASVGYVVYKYRRRLRLDMDDYFISGYRFKFVIGTGHDHKFELNTEELQAYSDKFKYYGDFIKEHSHREIPVVMIKGYSDDFCAINGEVIAVPFTSSLPASIIQKLPEISQKYVLSRQESAEAILMHELGHIVHHHNQQHIKITATIAAIQIFSSFGGIKYAIPTFIVTELYSLWKDREREYEADAYAVKHGYGPMLIKYFENDLERNNTIDSIFITSSGNNLRDIHHPLTTDRIEQIQRLLND